MNIMKENKFRIYVKVSCFNMNIVTKQYDSFHFFLQMWQQCAPIGGNNFRNKNHFAFFTFEKQLPKPHVKKTDV